MSALPLKADIVQNRGGVRLVPQAEIAPVGQLKNKQAAECNGGLNG